MDDLSRAITEIYSSTPRTDRGLRECHPRAEDARMVAMSDQISGKIWLTDTYENSGILDEIGPIR
jgi:hypothetical protein